jgi:hypothetical protein
MPRGGKREGAGRKKSQRALTPARLRAAILKAFRGDRALLVGLVQQMIDFDREGGRVLDGRVCGSPVTAVAGRPQPRLSSSWAANACVCGSTSERLFPLTFCPRISRASAPHSCRREPLHGPRRSSCSSNPWADPCRH